MAWKWRPPSANTPVPCFFKKSLNSRSNTSREPSGFVWLRSFSTVPADKVKSRYLLHFFTAWKSRCIWLDSSEVGRIWWEGMKGLNPFLSPINLLLGQCFYVWMWAHVMSRTISRPYIRFSNRMKLHLHLSYQEGSVGLRSRICSLALNVVNWYGWLVSASLHRRLRLMVEQRKRQGRHSKYERICVCLTLGFG